MGFILTTGYRQVYEEHCNIQDYYYFYLKIIHVLFKSYLENWDEVHPKCISFLCHNTLPQAGGITSLMVMEARSLKQRCGHLWGFKGLRHSLSPPASSGHRRSSALPSLSLPFGVTLSSLLFCLSHTPLCLSLMKTLAIGFRVHLGNPGWSSHLRVLTLHLERPFFQVRE